MRVLLFLIATCGLQAQGLPPRVSANDYQAQGKAGDITIAADFARHSVPTAQGTLSTEEFVVVELGLFGPPEAKAQVSLEDFTLRINGKKTPLSTEPVGLVVSSLKDPEWVPPDAEPKGKSKGGLTGGGGGGQSDANEPPKEVKVPFEVQRSMAQRTQKAVLPLGERTLPIAGLIFFSYRGKAKGISSVELIYSGSAGKATLKLQP